MHRKNAEIEALRAIAVIAVIISHIGNLFFWLGQPIVPHLELGVGVDLFFCISGFVITRSIPCPLNGLHIVAFYIRRFFRIVPSALFWIGFVILASLGFNRSGIFGLPWSNILDAVSIVLNVANFHFAECLIGHGTCGNNTIYWSLSLEEQFYIILPWLIFLPRRYLAIVVIIVFTLQFSLQRSSTILLMTRTDSICLGVLIAILSETEWYRIIEPVFLQSRSSRIAVSSILLLCLGLVAGSGGIVSFAYGMVAIISATLVLIASYNAGYLIRNGRLRRGLVWVGQRSFAFYLIHNPLIWLTREIWYRINPNMLPIHYLIPYAFTAVPLALVAVELNYRCLEIPLLQHGRVIAARFINFRHSTNGAGFE